MRQLDQYGLTSPRPPLLPDQSVALVHEWFSAAGGSENVFLRIADLLPHAERYVLWRERDAVADDLGLRESWLARTPLRRSKALALPVMPLAWRTLSRARFDVVISSSHAFAHTVRFGRPGRTRSLSYVHSPARYVWSPGFDGRGSGRVLQVPRRALRSLDVRMGRHVHAYAANSREVQARIRRYWHRDAVVIHPPVDVDFYAAPAGADAAPAGPDATGPGAAPRDYLLGVGRWIGYKRFDLMIAIAAAAGTPLVLAGSGPEESKLRRAAADAGVPVTFEVRPGRERLRALYQGALGLLFPALDEFGIVAVEAQAGGTPVLGLKRGGLLETVVEGETGFLVDSDDPAAYASFVPRLAELSADAVRRNATRFAHDVFAARMAGWIEHECA